ncbi:MAG: hypothetical protein QOH96_2040 [Blastocatellia bacterium]|nr:hypothetical protein [Blastocatellia bacterium]
MQNLAQESRRTPGSAPHRLNLSTGKRDVVGSKDRNADNLDPASHVTLHSEVRRVENREWWLWGTTLTVTLLLTPGIVSFLPSLLHSAENWESRFTVQQTEWGLVGVVLLFDFYSIYQQLQIHRIRRQLSRREELFRLISENAADMIAVVDVDGQRIYNSLSYEKVLGYSPEELKNSSGFEQIHPDDRRRVREAASEARRTGEGRTVEYRMRHKDGSWGVLESTSSITFSSEGELEKLVIVNRDITERKRPLKRCGYQREASVPSSKVHRTGFIEQALKVAYCRSILRCKECWVTNQQANCLVQLWVRTFTRIPLILND